MKNEKEDNLVDAAVLNSIVQIGILRTLIKIMSLIGLGLLLLILLLGLGFTSLHFSWITAAITGAFAVIFILISEYQNRRVRCDLKNIEDLLQKYKCNKKINNHPPGDK